MDIADKIEFVSFCPDIGLQGYGELFILGVVRAGGDGGDPGGGVEAKGSVAGTGDGSPGSQGVSHSREEGNRQFIYISYLVGLLFMGKKEMKFVGNIFLGDSRVARDSVPGVADRLRDVDGRAFAGLGVGRT